MTISQSCHFLVTVVTTFYLCSITLAEIKNNEKESLSGDFAKFLKDMESKVFKEKPRIKNGVKKAPQYTTSNPNVTNNTNIFHSQKAAIRDVLMLKLVSYYEDKYNLVHHEMTTSASPPPAMVSVRPPIKIDIVPPPPHLKSHKVIAMDILNDIEERPSAEVLVI